MTSPARIVPVVDSDGGLDGSFKSSNSSIKSRASYEAHLEWRRAETTRQQTRVTKAGFKLIILGTILYMQGRAFTLEWNIYGALIGLMGLLVASTSDLDVDEFMRDNTIWCGIIVVAFATVPVSAAIYDRFYAFFVAAAPYLYGICRYRAVRANHKGVPRWTQLIIVSIVLFLLVSGFQYLWKAIAKQWPKKAADGITLLQDRDGQSWDTGYALFALHMAGGALVVQAYRVDQRHNRSQSLSMWTAQCQGLVVIGMRTIVWSFDKEPNNAATSGAAFAAGVFMTVVPAFVWWYRQSLFGV